jgi:hypothetical protein
MALRTSLQMTRSLRISCGSRLETKPLYVVLVLACWLGGRSVNAQTNSIIGRVVAAADSTPVPFAMLSFPKLKHEQFTDEFGRFILRDLKPGQLNMRVRRIGFVPFEADLPVRDGATDTVVVYLTQFAIRLAAVTVSEPPLAAKTECRARPPTRRTASLCVSDGNQGRRSGRRWDGASDRSGHKHSP